MNPIRWISEGPHAHVLHCSSIHFKDAYLSLDNNCLPRKHPEHVEQEAATAVEDNNSLSP